MTTSITLTGTPSGLEAQFAQQTTRLQNYKPNEINTGISRDIESDQAEQSKSGAGNSANAAGSTSSQTQGQAQEHVNPATAQSPASDSLVGVSTYNYFGQLHAPKPNSGQVLTGSA